MTPPAILNPFVEIPKNLKRNCPAKTKTINVINETSVARLTIERRSLSVIPCVIVKKTGIVPKGLVSVKKEVKHNNAKGMRVSIIVDLEIYHRRQKYN